MAQHSGITLERWISFSLSQQILMIANELNRGKKMFEPYDNPGIKLCLERVLNLLDLTISANRSYGLRKELLRLRELIAKFYITELIEFNSYLKVLKVLLLMNPESARQIPFVI